MQGAAVQEMEGVVNEVYWALRALLDVGLLDPSQSTLGMDYEHQVILMTETLDWLAANMVGHGWWFTGTSIMSSPNGIAPAVLPTANVILLLAQAHSAIASSRQRELDSHTVEANGRALPLTALADRAETMRRDATEWLRTIQNSDGGYGTQAGGSSNQTDSAVVLSALCTDDSPETYRVAMRALKYLLSHRVSDCDSVDDSDVFVDYDQILLLNEGKELEVLRRPIRHEKPLGPGVLRALAAAAQWRWVASNGTLYEGLNLYRQWQFRHYLGEMTESLLQRQLGDGRIAGAFRGQRQSSMSYPVYYSLDAIVALDELTPVLDLVGAAITRRQLDAAGLCLVLVVLAVVISKFLSDSLFVSVAAGLIVLVITAGISLLIAYLRRTAAPRVRNQ